MNPRTLLSFFAVGAIASALLIPSLWAQSSSTGALTGTVTDATGAVVPGATVTLANTATNQTRTVTTGADGGYRFNLLEPGTYRIRITSSGFKTAEVPNLAISPPKPRCSTAAWKSARKPSR